MTNQRRVSDEIAYLVGWQQQILQIYMYLRLGVHTNEKQLPYTQIQLTGAAEAQTLAYTKAAANYAVPYIPTHCLIYPSPGCQEVLVFTVWWDTCLKLQEPAGAKFLPRDYLQNWPWRPESTYLISTLHIQSQQHPIRGLAHLPGFTTERENVSPSLCTSNLVFMQFLW